MNLSLKTYLTLALCTTIIVILAQITIPIPIIPLTMQTLAIGLIASILRPKHSFISITLYLLMGAIGLPVFAHFTSGLGILFGPTGGFLLSFPIMGITISYICLKSNYTKSGMVVANIVGMLINLVLGTIWLKYNIAVTWTVAISTGFTPFLIVGVVKACIAASVGLAIRKRLKVAKLLIA